MIERSEPTPDDVQRVRALLASLDPDLLAAVEEVDRTLIRDSLERSPAQRLAWLERSAGDVEALTGGAWSRR